MKVRKPFVAVVAAAFMACAHIAGAQDAGNANTRMIVAFPPSGSTDVFARLLSQQMSSQMGVSVVVENRAGANGNIGNEMVVRSPPDGRTLLFNTSAVVLSPALGEKLSYDSIRDFAPVALVVSVPLVLTTTPAFPVNTFKEFLAYLRANPDKTAYGSAGSGNITHLGSLMILEMNKLNALHVPYKGAAPALMDVVAGRLQFATSTIVSSAPLVKSKRLRGVAVTGLARSALLPDVPTVNEAGMPGFEVGAWYGVVAPAKTPPATVARLSGEILKALQEPGLRSRFEQEGGEILAGNPERYAAYINSELERWSQLVKRAGVKLD
jgi:tripartite-type tricarboxylate transporter receptor subunit TctC